MKKEIEIIFDRRKEDRRSDKDRRKKRIDIGDRVDRRKFKERRVEERRKTHKGAVAYVVTKFIGTDADFKVIVKSVSQENKDYFKRRFYFGPGSMEKLYKKIFKGSTCIVMLFDDSGDLIGFGELGYSRQHEGAMEGGAYILERYSGRGYGTLLNALLITKGTIDPAIDRIIFCIHRDNIPSREMHDRLLKVYGGYKEFSMHDKEFYYIYPIKERKILVRLKQFLSVLTS
jgi:L-amino acid N-acyltransferase YncA